MILNRILLLWSNSAESCCDPKFNFDFNSNSNSNSNNNSYSHSDANNNENIDDNNNQNNSNNNFNKNIHLEKILSTIQNMRRAWVLIGYADLFNLSTCTPILPLRSISSTATKAEK